VISPNDSPTAKSIFKPMEININWNLKIYDFCTVGI